MFEFILNGEKRLVEENKKLLKYLREDCNITSVKNGCSEGACGTCMVIVDGRAVKACILTTEKVNGKEILTIEGFTERERDVFALCWQLKFLEKIRKFQKLFVKVLLEKEWGELMLGIRH